YLVFAIAAPGAFSHLRGRVPPPGRLAIASIVIHLILLVVVYGIDREILGSAKDAFTPTLFFRFAIYLAWAVLVAEMFPLIWRRRAGTDRKTSSLLLTILLIPVWALMIYPLVPSAFGGARPVPVELAVTDQN